MTRVQRLLTAVLPARWAAAMQAESRSWIARCDSCGQGASVWDRGGIRWKASGNPRIRATCSRCERSTWHRVSQERS